MNLRQAIEQLAEVVKEVQQAVFVDDKTPLKNALALRDESALIASGESEFDVIVFGDLNRFKGLNDQYGHDAGDAAISEVGERIHRLAVEKLQAKAFRQSGDEFVILLKQIALAEFLQACASFAEILFSYEGKSLQTGMSFGYTISDGKTNFNDLLGRAETACQTAKNQGDGACIRWSEEVQRNALVNLRDRCPSCEAKINCNVPQQNAPAKLSRCPCCDATL